MFRNVSLFQKYSNNCEGIADYIIQYIIIQIEIKNALLSVIDYNSW